MQNDKSFHYYGAIYHRIFDPQIADARKIAVNFISEGASVLDIACGTGQLCFDLREYKHCKVVGIDLSLRMLEFARKSNPFQDVTFVHEDATVLSAFRDHSFDYATMLMVMHELPGTQQVLVLKEALRVADRAIIIDSVSPLPKNLGGLGIRLVELTFGHDHNPHFKTFLSKGGIRRIIEESGLLIKIEHTSVFWHNCREIFIISKQ